MAGQDAPILRVFHDWNGFRVADVRLGDFQDVHWFQPSGAPRLMLHGYISCASIVRGAIPHACTSADAPHRLLVCVLKRHTLPSVYLELAQRAIGLPPVTPVVSLFRRSPRPLSGLSTARHRGAQAIALGQPALPQDRHHRAPVGKRRLK